MSIVEISITGMTCGHCAASVTKELEKLNGVTDVAVDQPAGKATLAMSEFIPELEIKNAVSEAGYEVTAIAVH